MSKNMKVRILIPVPVLDGYVPEVGKVYDAIRGTKQHYYGKAPSSEFCIVKIKAKCIALRRTWREEPEYEEVLE